MRVLLDRCVARSARLQIGAAGHDVVWSGDWPEDPGDPRILEVASEEGRVLVTLDKDFGELVVVRRQRHAGIIRLVDIPARSQGVVCTEILDTYGAELSAGAIITAAPGRVRVRRAEPSGNRHDE